MIAGRTPISRLEDQASGIPVKYCQKVILYLFTVSEV
jgi:hypothetical protein